MAQSLSVLFLGDIVGRPGRRAVKAALPGLIERLKPGLVIANGENAAGGVGIDAKTAEEIYQAGVQLITTGNHVWKGVAIAEYLEKKRGRIVRPANFPPGSPGSGWMKHEIEGGSVGVLNVQGRVFMGDLIDCPFRVAEEILNTELKDCALTIVDFHAEATSEKTAFGYFLDGKASLVVGTHTHVQTADERILPQGTGFITDLGMCGPEHSSLGVEADKSIQRFRTALPVRFSVASSPCIVNGIYAEFDVASGKTTKIERVFERGIAC